MLVSICRTPKGDWTTVRSGTHTLPIYDFNAFAGAAPLPPAPSGSSVLVIDSTSLYSHAQSRELREAVRFVLLLEGKKFAEAAHLSILKSASHASAVLSLTSIKSFRILRYSFSLTEEFVQPLREPSHSTLAPLHRSVPL